MDHREALVTAPYAAGRLGVTLANIYFWRASGKIEPKGRRGRSPLYRWGDLVTVEKQTRRSPFGRPRSAA